jgi:hypothetical protein
MAEQKLNSKVEEEVKKVKDKIKGAAWLISGENDDALEVVPYTELSKEIEIEEIPIKVSDFALNFLTQHEIKLYYNRYSVSEDDTLIEDIKEILSSNNEKEILDALQIYADDLTDWAEEEDENFKLQLLEENIISGTEDIELDFSDAKYIVKVVHVEPVWNLSILSDIIKCKSEEEAKKVRNYVWNNWGDFGVPGGNLSISIEKVENPEQLKEEILNEYRDDVIIHYNKYHSPSDLYIWNAEDVLKGKRR